MERSAVKSLSTLLLVRRVEQSAVGISVDSIPRLLPPPSYDIIIISDYSPDCVSVYIWENIK